MIVPPTPRGGRKFNSIQSQLSRAKLRILLARRARARIHCRRAPFRSTSAPSPLPLCRPERGLCRGQGELKLNFHLLSLRRQGKRFLLAAKSDDDLRRIGQKLSLRAGEVGQVTID